MSLQTQGLKKSYGETVALDGLDLTVESGEFFALLGPSAAGKTTALRTICGVEEADAGRILLDGRDITTQAPQQRGISMVFQTFALYPHFSVFENLAYPLKQLGMNRAEIGRLVGETAEMLRLTHVLERLPGTASGGEQQRIAIGRALIRRPSVLLLDEPLTNLDAKLRHDTRAEFKRLHRELGMTVIYATPDELEALSMGQRIGVLGDHRMVQVGTPDEVYERPRDSYVATLVGSPRMNLVSAVRQGDDANPVVSLPFGEVSGGPWRTALSNFPIGTELLFGFRPYDVKADSSAGVGLQIKATVALTEPLGDVVVLDLEAKGAAFQIALPEEEGSRFAVGDKVPVSVPLERTHLFTAETGTAVL